MDDWESAFPLSAPEARVLGALMEKSATTPEYYPMTLNSLVAACNQRTSRDPVTDYDENEILAQLDSLREKGLVRRVDMAGSRAPKFRQIVKEALELDTPAFALMTVLLLRGPQTPGQLRARTERIHAFRDLKEIEATLHDLAHREEEPYEIARPLPRRPGDKEVRFAQTLSVLTEALPQANEEEAEPSDTPPRPKTSEVVEALSERVATLEAELASLREEFSVFRKEFE